MDVLFRGKRKDNGEWVYGGYCGIDFAGFESQGYIFQMSRYIPDTRDSELLDYYEENPTYSTNSIKVIPETVGQYTGLCDKNGTNVFEGDILEAVAGKSFRFVVKYGTYGYNVGFYCDWISCNWFDYKYGLVYWCDKCKVVGNVHDNPELITSCQ